MVATEQGAEFKQYVTMARQIAWKMCQAGTRLKFRGRASRGCLKRLVDEAESILVDLITGPPTGWPKYDPARGSKCTYINQMIRWKLYDFLKREARQTPPSLETLRSCDLPVCEKDDRKILEIVLDLPEHLREIVLIILQEPDRFRCRTGVTRFVSTPVYRYCREMGRSHREALETQMELEELFL